MRIGWVHKRAVDAIRYPLHKDDEGLYWIDSVYNKEKNKSFPVRRSIDVEDKYIKFIQEKGKEYELDIDLCPYKISIHKPGSLLTEPTKLIYVKY